jgi:hypothetical protein
MALSDFETLELARDYAEIVGRMTSPDMVVSLLTEHDSTLTLQDLAKANTKAAGFLLALNGAVTEYNLITGHAIGDKQQLLLAYLVAINAVTEAFKTAIIEYANPTVYPYANKTELDFQLAKGTIERKLISLPFENGKCIIVTTEDCEPHTPQIYRKFVYSNGKVEYTRIAGFKTVEKADLYDTHCQYFSELYVDDAYGVIS